MLRISRPLTAPIITQRLDPDSRINDPTHDVNACNFINSFCDLCWNLRFSEHYCYRLLIFFSLEPTCLVRCLSSYFLYLITTYVLFSVPRLEFVFLHTLVPSSLFLLILSHWTMMFFGSDQLYLLALNFFAVCIHLLRLVIIQMSLIILLFSSKPLFLIIPMLKLPFLGDFKLHHKEWLQSVLTDPQGEMVFTLLSFSDLDLLLQNSTRVLDQHIHTPKALLSFDLSPDFHSFPQGFSDFNLIMLSCCSSFRPSVHKI